MNRAPKYSLPVVVSLACTFAVFIASAFAGRDEEKVFRAYKMASTDPQGVAQAAQGIVGTNGTVFHDKGGSQLLVYTVPSLHTVIAGLMGSVNISNIANVKNIQITVTFNEAGEKTDIGAGISGSGNVVITSDVKGHVKVQPDLKAGLKHQTETTSSLTSQMIMMQSGGEASIASASEVAVIEPIVDYGRQYGLIQPGVEIKSVGSFLATQATVLEDGPLILVRLTPGLSGLINGSPQHIKYDRAATEITVSDGQTVTIGSFGQNKDFYDKFLIGFSRKKSTTAMNITLTAHIVGPDGK